MSTEAQKRAQRKYYQKNKEKYAAWHKEYAITHPTYSRRCCAATIFIESRKFKLNEEDIMELYDILGGNNARVL